MSDKHGTYIGPLEHLRGKTARVRKATHGYFVAQFDDVNLTRERVHPAPDRFEGPWPDDSLGLGWHAFPESHFKVEE